MLITWNESYSVGVEKINDQHKKLVEIINKLHEGMKSGQAKNVMEGILNELVDYTKNHFKTEEDLFNQYNYPQGVQHKVEHENLLIKVGDFVNKFVSGDAIISMELMDFLREWLINHIQGTDMQYKAFFNEKGLN